MNIINGQQIADQILENIKDKTKRLNYQPGLAVIQIGDNAVSEIYIRQKREACEKVGFHFQEFSFPKNTSQKQLETKISDLNKNPEIHGILIQLPIPKHLDECKLLSAISPDKDADCLHPLNMGRLLSQKNFSESVLLPCTAKGIIRLILSTGESIAGKKAVVIGRSKLVGLPTALLLLAQNATVTICHSQTKNLTEIAKQADIVVTAVGRPKFITAGMIKKNSIVVDVGINRIDEKVIGDVDLEKIKEKAAFITSVPGGVGPMTVACLLENTILLTEKNTDIFLK